MPVLLIVIDPDPVNCTHVLPDTVVTVGLPVVALYVARV
jgi:hypothetical protein